MRITKLVVTALTLLLSFAQAETKWEVIKTFPIGGVGGWDYLTTDSVAHRLYVPRTTHTMVIDTDSGKVVGDIPGQKNAHGVALAAGRGYIRSEEHTSELQSPDHLVCRLLLEK